MDRADHAVCVNADHGPAVSRLSVGLSDEQVCGSVRAPLHRASSSPAGRLDHHEYLYSNRDVVCNALVHAA